jgi:hypothetical protein
MRAALFALLLREAGRTASGRVFFPKTMKNPILIAMFCAFTAVTANAGAIDDFFNSGTPPSAELIKAMKEYGFDYMVDIPGIPGQSIEIWEFFDQGAAISPLSGKLEKFPVVAPAGSSLAELYKLAWSQRKLIDWEKANGFLKEKP